MNHSELVKQADVIDWSDFYYFVAKWRRHPGCDFALIPDVIDGTEEENNKLIMAWPYGQFGVPVWHLHESEKRLKRLAEWPRIAIGSSGEYAHIGTEKWWHRMNEVWRMLVDSEGIPCTKVHGLRMLDSKIVQAFPFASADSTNVARNIGIDAAWKGTYSPATKETRAIVLAERIEQANSPGRFEKWPLQRSF